MIKIKGGDKMIMNMIMNIFVFVLGIVLILMGIADILLSLKISLSIIPYTGKMNYFLLLAIWIGALAFLTGIDILFPGIKISTMPPTRIMIILSIKAIFIYVALLIYNSQKVNYDLVKA